MRIALFSEGIYPLKIGGIQKHSYLFSKYLAKKSVYTDIYFYTTEDDATTKVSSYYTSKELAFLRFIPIPSPSTPYFPGHFIYFSWLASKKLYAAFLESKQTYDLVYIQGFSGWAYLNKRKSVNSSPKTFLNFHGLNMFQQSFGLKHRLQQFLFRPFVTNCLEKADYNISLGGKLTAILLSRSSIPGKVLEIPIGIGKDWLRKSLKLNHSKIRSFIFIGRYERIKGIEELSQSIIGIDYRSNIQFQFVGPIPDSKKINLPFIKYHGLLKDMEKVKKILSTADILICPSLSEGMPTVILEAMASHCAIIATDVGAVSSLVSEKNGWLVKPGDVKDLKQAIEEAMAIDSNSLAEKQEASFQLVKEKYTWDAVIDQFLDTVTPLIQ